MRRGGGGELGLHTAGLVWGDAVEFHAGDRVFMAFDDHGTRWWIARADGTTEALPESPMPEGEFLPPAVP